ncbi:MAG: hypothetical protein HEQ35_29515 [Gloeotrichia echinulata IR180]
MAIVFCLLFQVLVFVIILPIIQKITGKEINLNYRIGLSLILFIPSLWIYAQIVLLLRGETEEIKHNISYLFPENFSSSNNFLNAIELSLQYNAPLFIFLIFFALIVSIVLYSKIKFIRKNLINKLIFIMLVIHNFYQLPFNIIDNHNESITRKKQEVAEVERVARTSYNATILDEYKAYYMSERGVYLFFPTYSRCREGYPISSGELSCEETKSFCTKIRSLYKYDVKSEYFDMLENAKSYCSREGWYESKNN